MDTKNHFKNTRIEFHILQAFPVTCLNRDDVGAPKTAIVGGSTRARVSSQCWKRQVRLEMNKLGTVSGKRTKLLSSLVAEACLKEGATEDQAQACGDKIEGIFIKKDKKIKRKIEKEQETDGQDPTVDQNNDTLIFFSPNEIVFLVKAFKEAGFNPDLVITNPKREKQAKELKKILDNDLKPLDAVDIALFGRMVAKAPEMNIEAAASFAHAISTHKVSNEVEFFTAIDDLQETPGSSHLGSLEFNSATYYRYISLDLGQLWQTLRDMNLSKVVEAFTKALFIAVPTARQSTMSGASQWDFAKILVRKGQRLQLPFESSIKPQDGGFLQPSIKALKDELAIKEKRAGSLFGKLAEYTFGESDFSIDDLVTSLKQHIEGAGKS